MERKMTSIFFLHEPSSPGLSMVSHGHLIPTTGCSKGCPGQAPCTTSELHP